MDAGSVSGEPRTMLVDQEHIGLRLVVPLLSFFACIGSYWVGLQLTADMTEGSSLVMLLVVLPGAILIALGTAWGAERLVRRYWPSGRVLKVDSQGISLRNRGRDEVTLNWRGRVNVLAWRFVIPPRRGRVPKGWYCMACELVQDDRSMTVYAFLPPNEAKEVAHYDRFVPLASRKTWERATPAERLAMGDQARYQSAEMQRWDRGAEMDRGDFAALVGIIGRRVQEWSHGDSARLSVEEADRAERPVGKGNGKPIRL